MKKLDAKLISSVPNINYLSNLYAFSETEREVFIILTKNKKYLITDMRYSEEAKKIAKDFKILDIGATNFINNAAKDFFKKENIKNLGIEENNLTVAEYKKLKKIVTLSPINLKNYRTIKEKREIINIKKACKLTDLAFKHILTKLKTGVREDQISNELVLFFRKNNADFSFKPIVAYGENSSVPHHNPSSIRLKNNQIVLLDFGVKLNNYCSDMTRTIFYGKADSKFKNIYKTVLSSQKTAINKIKSGEKASSLDKASRNIIKMNYDNIPHAVGHGIGLEVHEAPIISNKSNDIIKNGMVFTIEPGIYIPGYGGVRIEDIVLVRDGKAELISKAKRGLIELNAR